MGRIILRMHGASRKMMMLHSCVVSAVHLAVCKGRLRHAVIKKHRALGSTCNHDGHANAWESRLLAKCTEHLREHAENMLVLEGHPVTRYTGDIMFHLVDEQITSQNFSPILRHLMYRTYEIAVALYKHVSKINPISSCESSSNLGKKLKPSIK